MLVLAGCKKNESAVQTFAATGAYKIALITGNVELELDYNNAAVWEGITSLGESVAYSYYMPEALTTEAIVGKIELAVSEGANTVVCLGDGYGEAISQMQTKYGDLRIIAIDVPQSEIGEPGKNTHCIHFCQEQGGYLAGYGAVMDGFTKLGFMGVHSSENYQTYCYGFVQGASDAATELSTNIEIKTAYVSDFADEAEAVKACGEWYAGGTEVVMVAGGDSFVQGCAECAVEAMGYIIGTNTDQSYLNVNFNPDYNPFITCAMKGLREAVVATLEMMIAGSWDNELGGKSVSFGLENGNYIYLPESVGVWLFDRFSLDEYNGLKDKIASGSIKIASNDMPKVDEALVTVISGNTAEETAE